MEAAKADGNAVLGRQIDDLRPGPDESGPEALEALQFTHLRRPLTVALGTLLALTLAALLVPAALIPVRPPLSAAVAPIPPSSAAQRPTRLADLLVTEGPPGLAETELAAEYADGLTLDAAAELLGNEDPSVEEAFLQGNGYSRGVIRHWNAGDGIWLLATIYELDSERPIQDWVDSSAYAVATDPAVEVIASPVPGAVAYRRSDADADGVAGPTGFEVFFGKGNRLFHIAALYPSQHPRALEDVLTVAVEQYRRG